MTPYLWRLCCLSLSVWFVVQLAAGVVLRVCGPSLIRFAERFQPAGAARIMLTLRWAPAGCGLFAALCLCAPSYLRFEPLESDEGIGLLCLSLAALCVVSYVVPMARVAFEIIRSELRLKALLRDAEERAAGICVILTASPAMALAGLFRSRVLVSREVMAVLNADQMDAAIRHEQAHKESCDNGKRLLFEIAPLDGSSRSLRAAWSRFTEWAADDRATEGDSSRSFALASALVSVARLGTPECLAHASLLIADGCDLRMRVERLLEPAGRARHSFPTGLAAMCVAAAAGFIALVAQHQSAAAIVHNLLEALVD
jgi:hypothetical protein